MYEIAKTEVSKRVLLELSLSLSSYKDDFVLVGGWTPYFLTQGNFDHCGSIDIDLVLKPEIMPKYENIREIVERLDFDETENPFRFKKTLNDLNGEPFDIILDFLTEPDAVADMNLIEVQADLRAVLIRGCSIVFPFNQSLNLDGKLPDESEASSTIKMADLVGILSMKGLALLRLKDKDSYDIYALAGFYNGNPQNAAKTFKELVNQKNGGNLPPIIKEAFRNITNGFSTDKRFGAVAVSRFVGTNLSVDASFRVTTFLKNIK